MASEDLNRLSQLTPSMRGEIDLNAFGIEIGPEQGRQAIEMTVIHPMKNSEMRLAPFLLSLQSDSAPIVLQTFSVQKDRGSKKDNRVLGGIVMGTDIYGGGYADYQLALLFEERFTNIYTGSLEVRPETRLIKLMPGDQRIKVVRRDGRRQALDNNHRREGGGLLVTGETLDIHFRSLGEILVYRHGRS